MTNFLHPIPCSQTATFGWKGMKTQSISICPLCIGLLLVARLPVVSAPPETRQPRIRPVLAQHIVVVAKDFVIDVYHNGKLVPATQRELLLDRFGASVEKIHVKVRKDDWLVFRVANNRLRHGGTKYFAAAGVLDDNEFGFVSSLKTKQWTTCDDPANAAKFITHRFENIGQPAATIEKPWEEGMKFAHKYAGAGFEGEPLWGQAASTWIKFNAGKLEDKPAGKPQIVKGVKHPKPVPPTQARLALLETRRWPVQIISAIYGTGGRNADVTARVKQLVEIERKFFAANPGHLKADPNPYWNKSLHIVYYKDGVRREQRRNENEHILPESFYGPHDAVELTTWLIGTRWNGPSGEIQFQRDGNITGLGYKPGTTWRAIEKNRVQFTDSDKKVKTYAFDYIWSRFGDPKYTRGDFRIVR